MKSIGLFFTLLIFFLPIIGNNTPFNSVADWTLTADNKSHKTILSIEQTDAYQTGTSNLARRRNGAEKKSTSAHRSSQISITL